MQTLFVHSRSRVAGTLLSVLVMTVGCGGQSVVETVPIAGVVTLDGEPLAEALVTFHPENGRPASGITDEEGRYELQYKDGIAGTLPGLNKVSITTAIEADRDSSDPDRRVGRPERLPKKYHRQTSLEVEVSIGQQDPIDFDLEGKAKPGRSVSSLAD